MGGGGGMEATRERDAKLYKCVSFIAMDA